MKRAVTTGTSTDPSGNTPKAPALSPSQTGKGTGDSILLVKIAKERSSRAFEELYQRVERKAYGLAYRITRSHEGAEVVVQEGMLRVWRYAHTFDPQGDALSWILRVVAREGIRWIREGKRRQTSLKAAEWRMQYPDVTTVSIGAQTPVSDQQEALSILLRELQILEPGLQQMLALRYGGELSHREISEALGVHQSSVRRRILEGLGMLRSRLQGNGMAALAPKLLDAKTLGAAICDGVQTQRTLQTQVPPGTREQAVRPPAPRPLRPAWPKAVPAACAGLVLCCAATWATLRLLPAPALHSATPATPATPATTTAARRDSATPRPAAPSPQQLEPAQEFPEPFIRRSWDFEQPGSFQTTVWNLTPGVLRRGLLRRTGTFVLLAEEQGLSGFLLPFAVPPQPLTLAFKCLTYRAATPRHYVTSTLELAWYHQSSGEVIRERSWCRRDEQAIRTEPFRVHRTVRILILGQRIVNLSDQGKVLAVSSYRRPYPGDRLLVYAQNVAFEEISVEALAPREIPLEALQPEDQLPRQFMEFPVHKRLMAVDWDERAY